MLFFQSLSAPNIKSVVLLEELSGNWRPAISRGMSPSYIPPELKFHLHEISYASSKVRLQNPDSP